MHLKKLLLAGILFGVSIITTPIGQVLAPTVVYADEVSVAYDEEYSLITIKPVSGCKTYFSYKINGDYPTYTKDRICYFNEDGSLKEEKTGMLGTSIFNDDINTWIDVTKQKPRVAQDSDYYNELRKGDCIAVLPYSEVNDTNGFYIPVTELGTNISVNVVNVSEDGTVSDIKEYSYIFSGVEQAEAPKINAKVSSVIKKDGSEIITISGDNLTYVQLGSEIYTATKNSVEIELTSNGDYTFIVCADESMVQETVTHTVNSIKTVVNIKDENLENIAPTITTDTIPTELQTSAFKFKVYTDELAIISCDGVSIEGTELELDITGNGEYFITATDKAGNYSEKLIVFDCFGSEDGSYVLDRENMWGSYQNDEEISDSLPKTGDIALASVITIGGVLLSAGAVMIAISKKKLFK